MDFRDEFRFKVLREDDGAVSGEDIKFLSGVKLLDSILNSVLYIRDNFSFVKSSRISCNDFINSGGFVESSSVLHLPLSTSWL